VSAVGAGFPGRRETGAQLCGCDSRLIFEGWLPHDPVFVAVRDLGAGAAVAEVGRRVPIVVSRTARRNEREALWMSRARPGSLAAGIVGLRVRSGLRPPSRTRQARGRKRSRRHRLACGVGR
jgi:hypothetical protein